MISGQIQRRRREQRALRIVRSSAHQERQQPLLDTLQVQPVVVLPVELRRDAEPVPGRGSNRSPEPASSPAISSLATTQRLLIAHAQRTRHLLSHRSTVESLSRPRRREMVEEIGHIKQIMRTLQSQVAGTARSVEFMERLDVHLQRITEGLRDPDHDTDKDA